MPFQLPQVLDPGVAALLGALVGAGSSVIVQIVAAFVTASHETRTFRRTLRKETIASVADAYEHALNVLFNMRRGGAPDRATYGAVFAQLSLRGSTEVKSLMEEFQNLSSQDRTGFDIDKMIKAMQAHLEQLEHDSR